MKKQSVLFFFAKLLTGIFSFLLVSFRSRYFSPETLSDYYLLTKLLGVIYAICITWIPECCVRYFEETEDKKKFFSTYIISLAFSLLFALALVALCGFFKGNGAVFEFFPYVLLLLLTQSANDLISSSFRVSGKSKMFSLCLVFSSLVNFLVFLLIPASFGIGSIFIASAAAYLLSSVVGFFVLKMYRNFSFRSFDWHLFKRSVFYSFPLIFVWLSIWIFTGSDTFVISYLCGKEQVSFYNTADSISSQIIGAVITAFGFAVFPAMISSWNAGAKEKTEAVVSECVNVLFKYLIPASLGLMSVSFFIYGPLISASYNPNYEGSILICVLCIGQLFNGFYEILVKFWNLEEKNYKTAIISIISAVLNLVITFVVVYFTRQYVWAAVVTSATLFIRMIAVSVILRRRWRIRIRWKTVMMTSIASILMSGAVCCFLYFVGSNIWLILASVCIGVVIYFTFMALVGEMRSEKSFIKSLFNKNQSSD